MNLKKSIAREGLILLAIVIIGLAIYFIARHLNGIYLIQHEAIKTKIINNLQYSLVGYAPYTNLMSFGLTVIIFGYPIISLGRFILWAFKTLRSK